MNYLVTWKAAPYYTGGKYHLQLKVFANREDAKWECRWLAKNPYNTSIRLSKEIEVSDEHL